MYKELLGYWDSSLFKELQFYVRPCRNSTSNGTCRSQADIDLIFNDGYFGSFRTTGVVDPGNYERPIQYNPMNFYTRVSLKTYVFIELSLQHNEIQTDSGFLMENINIMKGIAKSTERQSVTIDPVDMVFELLIRLDRTKRVFNRKYDKIQDVLANVGGVFNVLMLFGSILLGKILEINFSMELIKDIFEMRQNSVFESNSANNPQTNISHKFNGFYLSGKNYFKNLKKRWKILWIAKSQIDFKLDVTFLMNKLLEIEKIKYLLFNSDQLYLFDLIPRPKIFNKNEGKPELEENLKNFYKTMVNKHYNNKKDSQNHQKKKKERISQKIEVLLQKQCKNEFEERLIHLLKEANVINPQGSHHHLGNETFQPNNYNSSPSDLKQIQPKMKKKSYIL